MYDEDLYALRKQDPSIVSVLTKLPKVTCHTRTNGVGDGDQVFQGRFILYDRDTYPTYGFHIMNEFTFEWEYSRFLLSKDDLSVHDRTLTIRSPSPYSSPTDNNLDTFASETVELRGLAKDTMVMMIWLHSRLSTVAQQNSNWGITSNNNTPLVPPMTLRLNEILSNPSSTSPSSSHHQSGSVDSASSDTASGSGSAPQSPNVLSSNYGFYGTSRPTSPLSASSTSSSLSLQQQQPSSSSGTNCPVFLDDKIPKRIKTPLFFSAPPRNYSAHRALLHKLFPKAARQNSGYNGHPSGHMQHQSMDMGAMSLQSTSSTSSSISIASSATIVSGANPDGPPGAVLSLVESLKAVSLDGHGGFSEAGFQCTDLTGTVTKIRERAVGCSRYTSVYQGVVLNGEKSELVAIKVLHLSDESAGEDANSLRMKDLTRQKLVDLTNLQRSLQHSNILPFLGICYGFSGPGLGAAGGSGDIPLQTPALVSSYCLYRDLVHYLKHNGEHVERGQILMGVTKGLDYLHSRNITHGGLNGKNILIDSRNRPRISDIGFYKLSSILSDSSNPYDTKEDSRKFQYSAPELIPYASTRNSPSSHSSSDDQTSSNPFTRPLPRTPHSDVYSYGLVTLLIATGLEPPLQAPNCTRSTFISPLADRERYDSAAGGSVKEDLWILVQACCDDDLNYRPIIGRVLRYLKSISVEGELSGGHNAAANGAVAA